MTESVFAKQARKHWANRYAGTIHVDYLVGGVPTDPKVIEGWIKTHTGMTSGDKLREAVAETMLERGVDVAEATELVAEQKANGFKRDEDGLYIEGRQLKACIKEAASIALAGGRLPKRFGTTNKGVLSFIAEHVFVVEDRLHVGTAEPSGVHQRFVHTWRGSAIQYEQYVVDAKFRFTVETDWQFSDDEWAAIWTTAERNGIGASRSQGFGRFSVVQWERLP